MIVNLTREPQYPEVLGPSGAKTSIRIMPRGRVDLPPGYTLNPRWVAANPGRIKDLKPVESEQGDQNDDN